MTLEEMKIKVYSLIEEYNEEEEDLTEDPDLALKMNHVINQIQNELARFKKIPAVATREVTEGEELSLSSIDKDIYQLNIIKGVDADVIGDTVIFNEEGTAKIFYYVYPEQINEDTEDDFKFDLSTDVLEIMPYGVAGDLLKSDVSSQYGAVYTARYREMIQELDPRYSMGSVYISEGIN
jgi:hypothetical protein